MMRAREMHVDTRGLPGAAIQALSRSLKQNARNMFVSFGVAHGESYISMIRQQPIVFG